MSDTSSTFARSLSTGAVFSDFIVERVEDLPEIDGRAVIMRHRSTGLPLMWLANDDENKSFSITFKTPPADDTGVFHILEHSVLCGSDRYPVKEPFVNLLKTSMQTFLNALTFSDKTMYPVASTNEQDLLNLIDVYMDAVLHPLLYSKRSIFEQEGWHFETEGDGAKAHVVLNGVVLNEMRGAMSDPDDVVLAGLNRALFPDTAYGYESGGNPTAIPSLTYEEYLETHRRHYNISNAHIVLYGDISLEKELELLDSQFLSENRLAYGLPNTLELQAPVVNLEAKRTMATTEDNASVLVGYVIGTFRDRTKCLACEILTDALMGSNEAPLKKTILDADLGCDADAFVYDGLLQPYVAFELRGIEEGGAEKFTALLDKELSNMAENGVPKDNLIAALDNADFALRERDSGYADGVALAISAMSGWLYDDNMATDYLRYEDAMKQLRNGLETTFWEDLIRDVFLTSSHHACCELIPSADAKACEPAQPISCTLEKAAQDAKRLHELQDTPDSPDALASLPFLTLEDVGAGKEDAAYFLETSTPLPCLYHGLPTRNIDYTYHYFDLSAVTWDEIPYVTLASSLLGKLDTVSHTAAQLDMLVESKLGRLGFGTSIYRDEETGTPKAAMVVSACALTENVAELAGIPAEIWSSTRFDDIERIKTVLQQQKLDSEQAFANSGNSFALARAISYTDQAKLLSQHFGNVDYYRFVCQLLCDWESKAADLPEKLRLVTSKIFRKGNDFHSFTGTKESMDRYWGIAQNLSLASQITDENALIIPQPKILNEAFIVPTDVCFVAKALDQSRTQTRYSGTWAVVQQALNYDYLWNEIRVKGGAYGCGIRPGVHGEIGMFSYRDPNIDTTLTRMDAAAEWLAGYDPSQKDMTGFIVSTVATHDAPRRPYQVARSQDGHYLAHRDPRWRQTIRTEILESTPEKLNELAEPLRKFAEQGGVCVFGSKNIVSRSKASLNAIELFTDK